MPSWEGLQEPWQVCEVAKIVEAPASPPRAEVKSETAGNFASGSLDFGHGEKNSKRKRDERK